MANGLGKGLSSLFGSPAPDFDAQDDAYEEEEYDEYEEPIGEIPVALIDNEPRQPRQDFNEEKLQELANSIREHGIMQPLVVMPLEDDRYKLIAGERRFRAAKMAGLDTVPVVVREEATPEECLELALIENIQREDLNPMEQAKGIHRLATEYKMKQEEIASRLSMSRSAIANYVRLVTLPEAVQEAVAAGNLSMGHAKALLAISDADILTEAARRVMDAGLSVRDTEAMIKEVLSKEPEEGTEEVPERPARRKKALSPEFLDAQERMSRFLDTKVRIVGNDTKGKITIEYGSAEQLNRLFEMLQRVDEG